MPNYSKWTADRTNNGNTELIELYQDDGPLTFSELFGLLQDNRVFAGWYTDLLKCSPFVAYFWEHPPCCPWPSRAAATYTAVEI